MRQDANSFYILQVSDFHISEESKISAENALEAVTNKISEMNIDIRYLIHTGDVINSKDISQKIEKQYGTELENEEYDKRLDEIVESRFKIAEKIFKELKKKLDITRKNVVICCGNHDKVRYKIRKKDAFKPFQKFLDEVCNHTELTDRYRLENINILVLNTNVSDDKKVTCVDCGNLKKILSVELHDEQTNWFYIYGENAKLSEEESKVNVIVAHQPLYDICEQIRLPYGSETQTTDFLSALQDFINGNGIYLCGDKHTSSIAASYIHDIPHYFCGHPFVFEKNNFPSECVHNDLVQSQNNEIDYNLIEIREGKTGQVRKIHLIKGIMVS
nr:metallophosphoesterase [uncultured Anaerostipes sp.]